MDARSKMADIVLPVTSSLERNDIGGSSRDRYVLAMHQAIAPQHQARHDFDISPTWLTDWATVKPLPRVVMKWRGSGIFIRSVVRHSALMMLNGQILRLFGNKGMSVYLLPPKHLCSLILSVKTHRLIHYRPRVAKLNY